MKNYKDVFEVTDKHIKGFFEEYRFLSNFHVCDIYYDGLLYPSTENAYQAAKHKDVDVKKKFTLITPAESKKLNRTLQLSPEEIAEFDGTKTMVMGELTYIKYKDQKLKELLLETGHRYLEETNYWNDTFWGVCNGVGRNYLGRILMTQRFYSRVGL
jgi:ribA/ribD-fused uncharacterized protein